ncbi:tetratricopeptide repeat protein [Oculatella sp. LEGE 06141]|uniref:tetratricopeptide repeat protein n=1 Tax=Oculatella sp. LEGE 06141 TaxID=1828648 RepID=UPI00187E74B9|nr:tetratricopeptide repeat protein [Oculatella sp. LEGE 06141]MBE9178868.1 tetratricopeptide repeat protein [Oculatella sp. LEGE 06141]
MGTSVNVTSGNFTADVVERSYEKPVIVDFFAQWCGPCQMLKPILEKLAQEYDFVLAKVDIDHSPDLANAYQIEGVPDVRIVSQGQMHPGFVGVLPEPQLRQLLAQLNLKSALETGLDAIQQSIATGETATAQQQFERLLQQYPHDRGLAIAAAKFMLNHDQPEAAERLLAPIQEDDKQHFAEASALRELIRFKQDQSLVPETELDTLYFDATQMTLRGDYEFALQQFLEIVSRDRKYRNEAARKAMVTIFNLLGDDHPLTRHFRKQLMLTLY